MLSDLERKLEGVIQKFQSDLATIRTGRASASLVEDLKVEAYGATMTLKELASITIPEPRQILIAPWDKTVFKDIEKALRAADLNPTVDEEVVRVVLPPLTGETREKLIREVGERAEEAKVGVRVVRRDAVEEVEKAKESKELSEDDSFIQKKKIDELVENYNRRMDGISQEKKNQLEI
ncbi:ribosome recycling factor [Candidatus Saccharibacteria bacterium]|nr:ribosome recycling factor [Candidatus Saccharibacteria bacterium]